MAPTICLAMIINPLLARLFQSVRGFVKHALVINKVRKKQ
jgi:hypothetical protein